MAELIDLGKHAHAVQAEAIKAEMDQDRLRFWQTMAVAGLHVPCAFPPCLKFAGLSIEDQVGQIFSEVSELAEALQDPVQSKDGTWLVELLDLHHAMETLYRIITDAYGVEALNIARSLVIEKNAARGYYQDAE